MSIRSRLVRRYGGSDFDGPPVVFAVEANAGSKRRKE